MIADQAASSNTAPYQHSLSVLHRCLSPAGFLASSIEIDNYARIWARDGIIAGLAGLVSGDTDLIAGMERTLTTLTRHQGPHGEIPSNITVDGTQVSHGYLVGRVDALLWYVIGVCAYVHYTGDTRQKEYFRLGVQRALFLAGCWEYNNRGFIYTPISGNWADEYIQQGYVLSDQLLYKLALQAAGLVFENQEWQMKATSLEQMLVVNYWPQRNLRDNPQVYHLSAYHKVIEQGEITHWLMAFSPIGYSSYFDGLAHALALIVDLGGNEKRRRTEVYIKSLEQQIGNALLPAFWPVIEPGDPNWTALQLNHKYGRIKNLPYTYHNGGLWPFITGLYAVGLMHHNQQKQARHLLAAINSANAQGRDGDRWEFSEYHHGQTHLPLGTKYMAWSAAAGVLAHQAVNHGLFIWPL